MQGCAVFYDDNCKQLKKFHPLFPVDDSFINEFIRQNKIELCELYYPPYNFKRTCCKGCPYSLDLQNQLYIMAVYFPEERKQCEKIWGKVYDEYRRIGYRLENSLF
jgi:3'-phosphoadenosine 5'-phosphosulfate sulfotransferase (PAPS reductase)/FAD synthetase